MDIIGRVNMPLFAKVLRYMDLARKHDIRFMLTIHEDYTKPAYYDQQALRDLLPAAVRGRGPRQAAALPAPLHPRPQADRHHRREVHRPRRDGLPGPVHARAARPAQGQPAALLVGVRERDGGLPAVVGAAHGRGDPRGGPGHADLRQPRRRRPATPPTRCGGRRTADIDFYTYHLYPHRGSTSPEMDFGAAADVLTTLRPHGRRLHVRRDRRAMSSSYYPEDRDADRRYIMRDMIWFSLVNGNPGCFFWNARGYRGRAVPAGASRSGGPRPAQAGSGAARRGGDRGRPPAGG